MARCSLNKETVYHVRDVIYNSSTHNYKILLEDKITNCEGGIFETKNVLVNVSDKFKENILAYNKNLKSVELSITSNALIKVESNASHSMNTASTVVPSSRPTHQADNSTSKSGLFFFLLIALVFFVFALIWKKRQNKKEQELMAIYSENQSNMEKNGYFKKFQKEEPIFKKGFFTPKQNSTAQSQQEIYNKPYPPQTIYVNNNQDSGSSAMNGFIGGVAGSIVGNALYNSIAHGHENNTTIINNNYINENNDDQFGGSDWDDDSFDGGSFE